jgi:hypothetical protein
MRLIRMLKGSVVEKKVTHRLGVSLGRCGVAIRVRLGQMHALDRSNLSDGRVVSVI